MPSIHEVTAIASKDLRGSQVIVTRAQEPGHDAPDIGDFLALLEAGIRSGKSLTTLPDELVQAMRATLAQTVDLAADIEDDVAL